MKVASDTLKDSPHYIRREILAGLARHGFVVDRKPLDRPSPDDVLVIWNRSRADIFFAERYEKVGAKVIVVENGYIGKDQEARQLYAMALSFHLGAGTWVEGPTDRWNLLDIVPRPWRASGREIVVLPQRGIGTPGIAMPLSWPGDVVARLCKATDRPIRVRNHPGKARTEPYEDLKDAWAAVTWGSGAGIKAIFAGVPVIHELPAWIGAPAARFGLEHLEDPFVGDRMPMFRRLAYAQWTIAEIKAGEPFPWLLA
ncbi:conserved hypothetical protein [Mesorhizobium plurifarium]|uniref:Uncharacterized protein n=1 Tax=Mesorhizobium plurifarium TaxID=69974 RepID=A0A090EF19_MESPL|nr:conserved hypothetical protein [Mesorhizobium plurifarium]